MDLGFFPMLRGGPQYGRSVSCFALSEGICLDRSRWACIEMALPRWMKYTAQSTRVMGFNFPEGLARDYEWTTRVLGKVHYCFWGNRYDCPTLDSFPTLKSSLQCIRQSGYPTSQPPGRVPGGSIPIDGTLAARTCHERSSLVDEADD